MKMFSALFIVSTFVWSGCAASDLVDDVSKTAMGTDVDALTCQDLVEESVALSADQPVSLLKVRQSRIVKDSRPVQAQDLPTGARELVVMSCVGTGVWSDGDSRTKVEMLLKVDADGDLFIYYRAI